MLERLLKGFHNQKPNPHKTTQAQSVQCFPTMVNMNTPEVFGLEYGPSDKPWTDDLEDYDVIETHNPDGTLGEFAILGDVMYKNTQYLVCMDKDDLALFNQGDLKGPHRVLIVQVISGVSGNDCIFYPIMNKQLHDTIYDIFIRNEIELDFPDYA